MSAVAVNAKPIAATLRFTAAVPARARHETAETHAGTSNHEISLSELKRGHSAIVSEVLSGKGDDDRELVLRLIEIGFVPGERVRVIAHGHPGRDPIALRIGGASGGTTFALRRFEASYIRVIPEAPSTKPA